MSSTPATNSPINTNSTNSSPSPRSSPKGFSQYNGRKISYVDPGVKILVDRNGIPYAVDNTTGRSVTLPVTIRKKDSNEPYDPLKALSTFVISNLTERAGIGLNGIDSKRRANSSFDLYNDIDGGNTEGATKTTGKKAQKESNEDDEGCFFSLSDDEEHSSSETGIDDDFHVGSYRGSPHTEDLRDGE